MTPACQYLNDATEALIEEFDALISRNFASERTISVSGTGDGQYVAVLEGRVLFPATPNLDTVIRFVRAFAIQTAGVSVDEDSVEYHRAERAFGHSVRVPSNVVPIRTPA
jgi:hypothetical protein